MLSNQPIAHWLIYIANGLTLLGSFYAIYWQQYVDSDSFGHGAVMQHRDYGKHQ